MQLRRGSYIMKMRVQRTADEHPAAVFCGEGRIMKKFLLALLAFITVSCPVFASDWVYLGKIGDKIVYLDRDSITKSYGEASSWEKFVKPDGSSTLCRISVRERDRSIAVISFADYDETGKVIQQHTFPYFQYDPILPDSLGELIYNILMKDTESNV